MAKTLVRLATVSEVEDSTTRDGTDGLRIKAQVPQDRISEGIPWASPLLPKMFQSVPKVGEAVLLITAETDNTKSQRWYIGPIIPQPQQMEECTAEEATSLIQGGNTTPYPKISNNPDTVGSFPSPKDVAVVGRGCEDIRLKFDKHTDISEIDISAGIRQRATNQSVDNNDDTTNKGYVEFNTEDPAYIQLKHGKHISSKGSSFVNVVADKINLMSNKDSDIAENLHDPNTMISERNFDKVMSKLHPAVKGDKLVELLQLMIGAIFYHVHPWAGMEQCGDWQNYINRLAAFTVSDILSDDVKLS